MKKYFILFLLTISTFLTAQEEEQIETASKWQIGQGNVAFGTNLTFSRWSDLDDSDNYLQGLGIGSNKMIGNNLLELFALRKIVDFGIFSVGSNGTYLAYGLTNDSMITISTDVATFLTDEDSDSMQALGNNLVFSYVYSNLINKNFNVSFAPYISVPFLGMIKQEKRDSYFKYNFQAPMILGVNIVGSLKSDSVFFDVMFNYNFSPETDMEVTYDGDTFTDNVKEIKAYSFAMYFGNNFSDTMTAKAGILITSMEINDHTSNGNLLQFAIENKNSNGQKFGLVLEYGLDSDLYDSDTLYLALTGKMEFVF